MKPTLKHIAAQSGVSISTVSRILRGKSTRDSDTVGRVLDSARALGYPIYNRQVGSRTRGSVFVALVAYTDIGEFYSSLHAGFAHAAEEEDAHVGLFHAPSVEALPAFIRALKAQGYDAAVLFLPVLGDAGYQEILEEKPQDFVVISGATTYNPVFDTVSFDSYRGGHIVGKHFQDRGYEEVGVVIGGSKRNESLLRKSGFTDYIEHHSDMELIWQWEGDYSYASGVEAYQQYRRLRRKPRAVFVINDNMCLGFMEAARRDGLEIPGDVALVGYDDLPICSYHYPSITSVHTDYAELGRTAITLVKERLRSGRMDSSGLVSMVPVSLSVRESS